jgi:hypothetical protein
MTTKKQLKELFEQATIEARNALEYVTEIEGGVSCSMSYDAGYYEGQVRLLSRLLNISPLPADFLKSKKGNQTK